tara:strand:- start:119 stop:682 length:564 start_codon:yes stop_codon:yes gene_type:complete
MKENNMIIGIAGYKGSGKDTVANVLQTSFLFEKKSFAQPIKDIIHNTFGIDKAILSGDNGERIFREESMPDWFYLSPRDMMQKIGMAFRDELHPDIWVKVMEKQIKSIKQNIVIPDVRFKNELELINKYGFCVGIKRPGYNGDEHRSEHALDDIELPIVFNNDSSQEMLYAKVYNYFKEKLKYENNI